MIFFNKVAFSKYLAVWLLSVSTKRSLTVFLKRLNNMYVYVTQSVQQFVLASMNFSEMSFKNDVYQNHHSNVLYFCVVFVVASVDIHQLIHVRNGISSYNSQCCSLCHRRPLRKKKSEGGCDIG